METSKRCSKCGEVKLLECFRAKSSKRDGREAACRACRTKADAARRLEKGDELRSWRKTLRSENVEAARAREARYRAANPEKTREARRRHYVANAEKIRAETKRYAKENFERLRAAAAVYRKANPERFRAVRARKIEKATDAYLASVIRLPVTTIKPEYLELKRALLQAKRSIRKIQRHFKEPQK